MAKLETKDQQEQGTKDPFDTTTIEKELDELLRRRKLAREGKTVEREPRSVRIYSFSVVSEENGLVKLHCEVSKGTYIRTLCHDIGAALGCGERSVLVTGDGSFGMNLNELATAVANQIPMVILLLDNNVLGMVRQWQTLFFDKHYSNTSLDARKTDFVKLAEAFGAEGARALTIPELEAALAKAFSWNGPYLIDCAIDRDEFVLPMLPPGGSMDDIITRIGD